MGNESSTPLAGSGSAANHLNLGDAKANVDGSYSCVTDVNLRDLILGCSEVLEAEFDPEHTGLLQLEAFTKAHDLPVHPFELEHFLSYCKAAIQHDKMIAKSRFRWVPTRISEERFWRGYISRLLVFAGQLETDNQIILTSPIPSSQSRKNSEEEDVSGSENDRDTHTAPEATQTEDQDVTSTMKTAKVLQDRNDIEIARLEQEPKAISPPRPKVSPKKGPMMHDSSIDEVELVLISIRECFVYAVPPRAHSAGYYAQSWGLDTPLRTCRLQLVSRRQGHILLIRLVEQLQGVQAVTLFAQSVPLPVKEVVQGQSRTIQHLLEPVLDSSRYFVVRFLDSTSGKQAMLGVGFRDRSSAFDLNAALADHMRRMRRKLDLGYEDTKDDDIDISPNAVVVPETGEFRPREFIEPRQNVDQLLETISISAPKAEAQPDGDFGDFVTGSS